MPESTETRTYEIRTKEGVYRIEVPAGARVSYGPVIGASGKASYADGGNCLRIWEGTKANEVQRALFQNVTSFRDLSLPLQVRAVRMFGHEEWWQDDGSWTGNRAPLVEKGWKSADEIVPQTEVIDSVNTYTKGAGPTGLERRDRSFTVEPVEEVKW